MFIKQYFAFQEGLTVQLNVDGNLSKKISVHNGHDQGSSESQPVFCVEVSSILEMLDSLLPGIEILGKRRSVRGFSDNSGMYVSDPVDINIIESVYSKVR